MKRSWSEANSPPRGQEALLVLDAELTREVSSRTLRLAPTYVGARRIRASTKAIATVLRQERKQKKEEANNNETDSKKLPTEGLFPTCSAAALQQELADLRGERVGVPPILLSAPLALQLVPNSESQQSAKFDW